MPRTATLWKGRDGGFRHPTLAARQLVSQHQYLELEEERITQQQDLAAARNQLGEVTAALAEINQRKAATHAEYFKGLLSDQREAVIN